MEIELGQEAEFKITPILINKLEDYFYEEVKTELKTSVAWGMKDIFEGIYQIKNEEDYNRGFSNDEIREQVRESMIEDIFPEEVFDYENTNNDDNPCLWNCIIDQDCMQITLQDRGQMFEELLEYGIELLTRIIKEEINKWEVKHGSDKI